MKEEKKEQKKEISLAWHWNIPHIVFGAAIGYLFSFGVVLIIFTIMSIIVFVLFIVESRLKNTIVCQDSY